MKQTKVYICKLKSRMMDAKGGYFIEGDAHSVDAPVPLHSFFVECRNINRFLIIILICLAKQFMPFEIRKLL